jgi:hypothetical protein
MRLYETNIRVRASIKAHAVLLSGLLILLPPFGIEPPQFADTQQPVTTIPFARGPLNTAQVVTNLVAMNLKRARALHTGATPRERGVRRTDWLVGWISARRPEGRKRERRSASCGQKTGTHQALSEDGMPSRCGPFSVGIRPTSSIILDAVPADTQPSCIACSIAPFSAPLSRARAT